MIKFAIGDKLKSLRKKQNPMDFPWEDCVFTVKFIINDTEMLVELKSWGLMRVMQKDFTLLD